MVDGDCTDAFAPLRDLLARNLDDGADLGAAVAVVADGELVADIWGGEARPGVPWERDTIVQVWSVTKTMASLTVLVLAARGDIGLDAPAADYWPAFGVEGKDDVRVRHLLGHTGGSARLERCRSPSTSLMDLQHSEALLATEAAWCTSPAARRLTSC